jgi:hypothetical protein
MTFADGSEEIIATVDAGWGRNTWGSFAWGENITIFANLVGQQLSTNIGTQQSLQEQVKLLSLPMF